MIRTILYQAIREGIFSQEQNPFFTYKLKKKKTYKEKLNEVELNNIRDLILNSSNFIWDSRNYFLASYNLFGIRFSDLCRLRGENIHGNRIIYKMSKTGRKMSIFITGELESILLTYHDSLDIDNKERLFPLLDKFYETPSKEVQAISSRNAQVNSCLDTIAKRAKIKKNLSFHIARHTFADVTRKKGIDVYDISKILGHSSVKQTETYLATLDTDSMDEAAKLVYG